MNNLGEGVKVVEKHASRRQRQKCDQHEQAHRAIIARCRIPGVWAHIFVLASVKAQEVNQSLRRIHKRTT
jgi:hypothetical protein